MLFLSVKHYCKMYFLFFVCYNPLKSISTMFKICCPLSLNSLYLKILTFSLKFYNPLKNLDFITKIFQHYDFTQLPFQYYILGILIVDLN